MSDLSQMHFMVVFDLPQEFTEEMANTIPKQRRKVDQFFQTGKLLSYTLAADRSHLWAIFICDSEYELVRLVNKLPMTRFFTYSIYDTMFHSSAQVFPSFSVN
jgi:muconolactone delta-isomerase